MINTLAPLAPELAVQLEKHEQKRANLFKGNAKLPYIRPDEDPVLNDFKREMLFHRQAQSAVLEAIPRLHFVVYFWYYFWYVLLSKNKIPDWFRQIIDRPSPHVLKLFSFLGATLI